MRWIAIIVGIVILLVAILAAVPLLIPTNVYRDKLITLVKAQTGRDLVIGGDVGLSFFPRLAVKVNDVRFANAGWAKDADMASMKEMRAALKIMPLIHGAVEINSFVLVDPVIHLEIKADGTPNWQFKPSPEAAAANAAPESAPASQGEASSSSAAQLKQIRLGEVSIENGTATYHNAQTGKSFALNEVNIDLSLPSLDDPFKTDGSVVWNNEKIGFTLAAERPRAFSEGGDTPVDVSLKSTPINASYKGMIQPLDGMRFQGGTELSVPSVRNLAAWLGSPLSPGNGFGALSISGNASGKGNTYIFSNAKISLDSMNGTGDLAVQTGGARPLISGKLAVDRIDANTYMAGGSAAAPAPSAPGAAAPASAPAASSASGEGWSTAPIDLSGLRAADARFSFSTNELLVKKIKVGVSALTLKLDNGLLTVNLSKLALYQGSGTGTLTLNGASATPALGAAFTISGVSAEPFLTDLMDFKRLEGKTNINLNISTQGRSQRDMIGALGGNGSVRFTNGAIKGINLAQLARTVLQAAATGWQAGGSQDTDFSELGGTFTIARGILTNNDLKLVSPLLRVTGAGTVDLPNRLVNYRVDPKVVASLQGQGGADAQGINIPVFVEGPWTQPHFRPDLVSMLQNKDQIIDAVKSLKGGGGKELLNNLIGGGAKSEGGGGETAKPNAADALKSLFGR